MKKLFILAAFLLVLGTSCKKDRQDLLLGDWMVTEVMLAGVDVTDQFFEACSLDDVTTFQAGGVLVNTYNNLCAWETEATETGTWALSEDGNILTTVVGGSTSIVTITELSSDHMTAEVDVLGDLYEFHFHKQ